MNNRHRNGRCRAACRALLLGVLALPLHTRGQTIDDLKVASDDVSLRDGLLSSLSGVSLEAGEADKQARIRWSVNTGDRSMSFAIAAPVPDDGEPTKLASLDGLADALTFSASMSRYFTNDDISTAFTGQTAICQTLSIPSSECDDETVLARSNGSTHRQFLYATIGGHTTPFISFEAKLGREKVEFFDPVTLAGSSDHEKPYSVGLNGGFLYLSSALLLGLRYEDAVAKSDKVTRCVPYAADSNFETCKTLRYGAPDDTDSWVVSVEYRRFMGNIAVSPRVSYNSEDEVTGIEVPVYFLKDKDGQFTGGIRFGYRDDEDELTTAIFITKALSLQ